MLRNLSWSIQTTTRRDSSCTNVFNKDSGVDSVWSKLGKQHLQSFKILNTQPDASKNKVANKTKYHYQSVVIIPDILYIGTKNTNNLIIEINNIKSSSPDGETVKNFLNVFSHGRVNKNSHFLFTVLAAKSQSCRYLENVNIHD